jgi:hypothetical protein
MASPKDTFQIKKVLPVCLSEKEIVRLVENYFSKETNSSLTIRHNGEKLTLRLNADKSYQLTPTYQDAFKITEWDCDVQLIRSYQNNVSSIKFYFASDRGIEYKKQR